MKLITIVGLLGASLESKLSDALADEASALANAIREELATPVGGPHSHPWLRTGTLHDSVSVSTTASEAVIGSSDPVALYQEQGSDILPPRPTFGPMAALAAPGIAKRLGKIAHEAITAGSKIQP